MFIKILKVIASFSFFVAKNLFRLTLVIAYGLFKFLSWLLILLEDLAFKACVATQIFKVEIESAPEFEKKFSDNEIENMAEKFGAKDVTIKEIQDKLGVSYRQARKIQQAAQECTPVHHFRSKAICA